MRQSALIAELSTVAGLAATRFGMTIGGSITGGVTGGATMPPRAGRV